MAILAKSNGWLTAGKIEIEDDEKYAFKPSYSKHCEIVLKGDCDKKIFEDVKLACEWVDQFKQTNKGV